MTLCHDFPLTPTSKCCCYHDTSGSSPSITPWGKLGPQTQTRRRGFILHQQQGESDGCWQRRVLPLKKTGRPS